MNCQFPPGAGLIAVSGGADSVALLRLACAQRVEVTALHCNFHLRGEESQRDENFVRQLCRRLQVPLLVRDFSAADYARQHGVSVEMAARTLRYEWFEQERRRLDAKWIAVAHHREDQAETILLNLVRGTGPLGLQGMRRRNGYIVRPLLDWAKKDILNYLTLSEQDYVTDSSNMEREAQRNVLRLDVMPLLQGINPQAVEHICHTALLMQDALSGLQEEKGGQKSQMAVNALTPYSLYLWLSPCGFSLAQQRDIFLHRDGPSGAMWLSATHRLLRDRGQMVLRELSESALPEIQEQVVEVSDALEWLRTQPKRPDICYLDADTLVLPLEHRFVHQGDRLCPFGMKGSKLVSDLLTDLKFNRFEKEHQSVMTSGDRICWVVGVRGDQRFRVTPETRRVMVLKKSFS